MPNWGSNYSFSAYSLKHAVVLVVMTVLAVAVVAIGRSIAQSRRRAVEVGLGVLLFGIWGTGFFFDLANTRATASTTLPLHWCDLCGLLAPFVMLAPQYRIARAVLHFWALCMCSFAFLMPVMGLGPVFIDFWIYFGTHAAIVLTAVYDRCVRDFVPGVRDIAWAWGLAFAWVIVLQPINFALMANYGFVGPDDKNVRRAIRALGVWPWRLAPMLAINLGMMIAVAVVQAIAVFVTGSLWQLVRPCETAGRSLRMAQPELQRAFDRAA